MIVKLTLDTNCILIEGKDSKKTYYYQIRALEHLANKGLVRIIKTDVQDTEIGRCRDRTNPPEKMVERLGKSASFEEQCGIAVVGYSRLGHCRVAGFDDNEEYMRLRKSISDTGDVMTIMTHMKYGNDFIITENSRHFKPVDTIMVIDPRRLDSEKLEAMNSDYELRAYLSEIANQSV